MPVYVDQNGNYYFAAATISPADSLLATARADLVAALTAVTPQKRQVSFQGADAPLLLPAVEIPDSAYASAPSTGNRKITTALHPTGNMLANDSFVVPDGIYQLWTDFAGGGAGGGGGNATPGGGGGGGAAGAQGWKVALDVFPGELITVLIGGAGAAGGVGLNGGSGGATQITGSVSGMLMNSGIANGGLAGGNPNGGNGGTAPYGSPFGATGGAGAGPGGQNSPARQFGLITGTITHYPGSAGGALNFNGGTSFNLYRRATNGGAGGTGGAAGGGGGGGGCSYFGNNANFGGDGGTGGSNGSAGLAPADLTSYGAGGGGGSGNAPGGAGAPGFARFYY